MWFHQPIGAVESGAQFPDCDVDSTTGVKVTGEVSVADVGLGFVHSRAIGAADLVSPSGQELIECWINSCI